jgi:hypothetical protein
VVATTDTGRDSNPRPSGYEFARPRSLVRTG